MSAAVLPAEAAALLSAMAEHGIRVDDRRFEQAVRVLLAEFERLRPFERRALDAEATARYLRDGLGELCSCSYDPDGPGPSQECPVDGDGVTFVAEVRRLLAVDTAARRLLVALDEYGDEAGCIRSLRAALDGEG